MYVLWNSLFWVMEVHAKISELVDKQVTTSFRQSISLFVFLCFFFFFPWPAAFLISLCSMATSLLHYWGFAPNEKGVCVPWTVVGILQCMFTFKSPFLSLCRGLGQGDMGNLRPGNKGKLSEKPPFNPSVPDWGKTELPWTLQQSAAIRDNT